jgi:hypothetical protein
MVNFYFEDDAEQHICEVQLVHSQLFRMRKNMGAHHSYGIFRGAMEILEMLDLDPEVGASAEDVELLNALVWRGGETVVESEAGAQVLHAKVSELENQVARQNTEMAALKIQVAKLETLVKDLHRPPQIDQGLKTM